MILVVKILVKNFAEIDSGHKILKASKPRELNFETKFENLVFLVLMNDPFSVRGKKENTENLNVSHMREHLPEEQVSANNLKKNMKSPPVETI